MYKKRLNGLGLETWNSQWNFGDSEIPIV